VIIGDSAFPLKPNLMGPYPEPQASSDVEKEIFSYRLCPEPLSGRPKTATTPEIVDKIHHMVLADRRIKVHEIGEAVRMSDERVFHILHNEFDLKKLSARCVPRSSSNTS
jgi:hypothetical protein